MDKHIDIIILGMSRLDKQYSSTAFSIAKEMSMTNRVFYINRPYTYKDLFAQIKDPRIRKEGGSFFSKNIFSHLNEISENFVSVKPPFTLPINWVPNTEIYKIIAKYNDHLIFETIRKIREAYHVKDFIFYNFFNPFYARKLPPNLQPLLTLYHSCDDISQEKYIARHGVQLEKEAVNLADIVFATSKELTRKLKEHSFKVHYIPNGAEIGLFKRTNEEILQRPEEMGAFIGKKVIGYIGNICARIDYELIKKTALNHPDKIVLMIGPRTVDEWKTHGLHEISNIVFPGSKAMELLPSYLKYIDVTMIPFKCNTLTKSIYPLKLNEYLAAGKPVVSTSFSEDVMEFEDTVYIDKEGHDFVNLINAALNEDNEEKRFRRIEKASANSWSNRTLTIQKIIGESLIESQLK